MKRVACLSTIQSSPTDASSSFQVIEIFNSTRAYNLENQITGSFIVYGQYLLMVIEGDSTHLGNIIFNFRNDPRLQDFSLILNTVVDTQEYKSWGIKLLKRGAEGQDKIYDKLQSIFVHTTELKSDLDKQRLKCFLTPPQDVNAKVNVAPATVPNKEQGATSENVRKEPRLLQAGDFSDSMISLSGWPKPGRVRMCPELMRICARLVGRPHKFNDLLQENVVASENALVAHLNSLYKLGILRKHKLDEKPPLVGINGGLVDSPKSSSADRFSSVLRNFLSATKH